VAEFGGWVGDCAAEMLRAFPPAFLRRWTNAEVCRGAVEHPATDDPRYQAGLLEDWLWVDPSPLDHGATVLIAGDVIEHMRTWQLATLFARLPWTIGFIYLASPITKTGQTWDGYNGSHILECGWDQIEAMLDTEGFGVVDCFTKDNIRVFERRKDIRQPEPTLDELYGGPPE